MVQIIRHIGLAILVVGLGCAKQSDAPAPKAKATPGVRVDYDEGGYPILGDRKEGIGSTYMRDDQTEQLDIPLREKFFEDEPVFPREIDTPKK